MATRKKTTAAAQAEPAPIESTSTEPVTLSDLPPAETFQGLVAYGVDTNTDQSVQIPLEFVAQGAQAAVDAAAAANTAAEHANTATTATQEATTAANTAAEAANTAAADLEQLKTDCADATTAANTATAASAKQTAAAKTATTAANTAAGVANTKAGEASAATQAAKAAATRATEAAQNLTDDVAALVPYVGENLAKNTALSVGAWYWFSAQYAMPITADLIKGKQYTVSLDVVSVDGNSSVVVTLFLSRNHGNEIGQVVVTVTTWHIGQRVSVTFTPSDNYPKGSILSYRGGNGTGGSFANTKLEVGPKATPYLPNPADIARAIDYSLLTEQEVPGEKWPDPLTAQPKQVYVRTFRGTTPTSEVVPGQLNITLITGISQAAIVSVVISAKNGYKYTQSEGVPYLIIDTNNNLVMVMKTSDINNLKGVAYQITIAYTK